MDSSEKEPLVFHRIYDASAAKVWNAITQKPEMAQWFFPMMEDFKPEPGFVTEFDVIHPESGTHYLHRWTVTEANPPKKLSYEWKYPDYPGNGLLTFDLNPQGNKTDFTLTFRVLETFEPQKYPELSMENFRQGWTHFVSALGEFLTQN